MTLAIPDLDIIESLDFAPPCRTRYHTDERPPADWIIWPVRCCEDQPVCNYACDDCLQHVLGSPGGSCHYCHKWIAPMRLCLARVEPVRGNR